MSSDLTPFDQFLNPRERELSIKSEANQSCAIMLPVDNRQLHTGTSVQQYLLTKGKRLRGDKTGALYSIWGVKPFTWLQHWSGDISSNTPEDTNQSVSGVLATYERGSYIKIRRKMEL